ncbi:hypothetical protein SAMN06273572_10248 [Monaibacterium marinum]|uniref:Uncharacterized protein n=1 Tax=Pontivivens marinum TaxID=1690039 RepID=A0A2C9CQ34_9RHOB|nr:hypothetical protein [Monaibacterium marinum]SOH93372.1 hypothetical protein SAMN06273572_10248 [Monaibacterium marinum]
MIHQRTHIRSAAHGVIRAALAAGITVRQASPYDLGRDLMPCVFVTGGDGSAQVAGQSLAREMMLEISIVDRGTAEAIEDQLDALQAQVEIALAADPQLGGACQSLHLTQEKRAFEKAEDVLGEALLLFRVVYGTTRRDPTTLT